MAAEIALPYRTDWRELKRVLEYCKGKGADRAALEARFGGGENLRETLNALEQFGLIERGEGGEVRLTMGGDRLAYAPGPDEERARLVDIMLGYAPYRFPLERAAADRLSVLDAAWVEHIWQVDMRLGQPRNRVEEARTLFFRLADEAGLGTYRRGVRGQTTRLDLAPGFASVIGEAIERRRRDERLRQAVPPAAAPSQAAAPGALPAATPPAGRTESRPETQPAELNVVLSPPAGQPGGAAVSLALHIDMSTWDLERIEAVLRLLGLVAPRA